MRLVLSSFFAAAAFAQVPTAAPSVTLIPAPGGAYPTITAALATTVTLNDTLIFACSGLAAIPPLAAAACPGPVVLQPASPMLSASVTVGLVGAGNFVHVSLSEICLPGQQCGFPTDNRVVGCTAPCEIDGQPPTSGEYAVAVSSFNLQTGTFFTAPASRWNGYLVPIVTTMPASSGAGNCGPGTLTSGVTWTQTPWQITISCQ